MPKKPKINATKERWANYEKDMVKYVAFQNEITRRKELKAKVLSKIKDKD